jgi:hypothetical protein
LQILRQTARLLPVEQTSLLRDVPILRREPFVNHQTRQTYTQQSEYMLTTAVCIASPAEVNFNLRYDVIHDSIIDNVSVIVTLTSKLSLNAC